MRFRPCIDIHDGSVKQIIGGSLRDIGTDTVRENFVASEDASYFALLYRDLKLTGGHVILLNGKDTPGYEATRKEALKALSAAPGTLMAGGGITPDNAAVFLDAGATHVIVTSYVFSDGVLDMERVGKMRDAVGKDRLVLDLSCRRKDRRYHVATDRWQTVTETVLSEETLDTLAAYCDEFLIHAADVEGLQSGIEEDVVKLLGRWSGIPVTYAGGIRSPEDIKLIRTLGRGHVDFTVGSALDIFGGTLPLKEVLHI